MSSILADFLVSPASSPPSEMDGEVDDGDVEAQSPDSKIMTTLPWTRRFTILERPALKVSIGKTVSIASFNAPL